MIIKEPPMSDIAAEALRERNEARAREAIARLGRRYVLHSVHAPQRIRVPASRVLGG